MDHSEPSVQIIVAEQGVADLRGKDPHERAHLIIENCAHPAYREQRRDYLKLTSKGHAPRIFGQRGHAEDRLGGVPVGLLEKSFSHG